MAPSSLANNRRSALMLQRLAWMTPNPSGLVVDPGGYPLLQLAREPNDRSRSGLCNSSVKMALPPVIEPRHSDGAYPILLGLL